MAVAALLTWLVIAVGEFVMLGSRLARARDAGALATTATAARPFPVVGPHGPLAVATVVFVPIAAVDA